MASKADTTMVNDSGEWFTADVANRVTRGGICDQRQRNETLSSDVACRNQASTRSKSDWSIRPRINSSGGESGMALLVGRTVYYATRGSGISILAGSIFWVGLEVEVIEGQSFSTGRGSISNPNRICKKLWGSFGNVKRDGWHRSVVRQKATKGTKWFTVERRSVTMWGNV